MKCHEVRRLFFLYFDSELDARSVQEVHLHLEHCRACRERWSLETALEESIGRAAWSAAEEGSAEAGSAEDGASERVTGDAVWAAVDERLHEASEDRPSRRGVVVAGVGLAAILCVCIGLVWFAWTRWNPTSPLAVVASSVEAATAAVVHHEKYLAGKSPLQIRGGSADVRAFFAGELGFVVRAPDRAVEGDLERAELLGGRRCTFLGSPVAYLVYRVRGHDVGAAGGSGVADTEVTVILGPSDPPADLFEAITDTSDGVLRVSTGDYNTIFSSAHGILFGAAGDVDHDDLESVLRAFRAVTSDQ